nr:uncharacterized protein LOC109155085 [Ipomoea trifida]
MFLYAMGVFHEVTLNVDATVNAEEGCLGFGCVLRDDHRRFVAARGAHWKGKLLPKEAEALSNKGEPEGWAVSLPAKVSDSIADKLDVNAIHGEPSSQPSLSIFRLPVELQKASSMSKLKPTPSTASRRLSLPSTFFDCRSNFGRQARCRCRSRRAVVSAFPLHSAIRGP